MWATQDTLKRRRLNRGDIIGRLFYPMHDTDEADAVADPAIAVDGNYVLTTETTHYTVPASNVAVAIVHRIYVVNALATAVQVSVHLVPSGGARAAANQIWKDVIPGKTPIAIEGPWFLATGDTIRSIGTGMGATDTALRADLLEIKTMPPGVTLVVDQGDVIASVATTYYTAPSAGVTKVQVVGVTLCNTDSVGRSVQVWLVPSGQAAANRYLLFDDTIEANETVFLDGPLVLDPSDFIRAVAPASSNVSLRISPMECE